MLLEFSAFITSYIRMSGPQVINLCLCTGDHCTSNFGTSPLEILSI